MTISHSSAASLDPSETSKASRVGLDAAQIARVAVFAAFVAALGLPGGFSVFSSVPITAQTLGVMLAGAVLGPWLGALAITVLLALTAMGLPLLAGGRGGPGVFVGPSAGYLVGWVAGALVIGLIVHIGGRKPTWWRTFAGAVVGGILVVYAFGIPVQSLVTQISLGKTMSTSLVYLPGDLTKVVLTAAITMTLVRGYPRAFRRTWTTPRSAESAPADVTSMP